MFRVKIHFQVAKICISTTNLLLTITRRNSLISCKEAADEFCTKTSAPNTGKPDLESFFSGRLTTKEELLEFALPQIGDRCKQADSCPKRVRSRRCSQILFLVLCENLFKTFPSLPNKNLLCLAILQ